MDFSKTPPQWHGVVEQGRNWFNSRAIQSSFSGGFFNFGEAQKNSHSPM